MPVEEIPEDMLFVAIPLKDRLKNGVAIVKELALRQRQNITEAAEQKRQPEARIREFSNSGKIRLGFTEGLQFSEDQRDQIMKSTE